jgi:hypothetical protein
MLFSITSKESRKSIVQNNFINLEDERVGSC